MNRDNLGLSLALLAAAGLGSGYVSTVGERYELTPEDLEREERLRAERVARRAEREALAEAKRRYAKLRVESYANNIDPTNGTALTRQQRRRITQKGIPSQ